MLGRLQHEQLLPVLEQRYRLQVVCETALAPGGLQLARSGVGISWVPHCLATHSLATRELVDLSRQLGRLPLDIVVLRLRTPRSRLADCMWAQFALTTAEPSITPAPA